MNNIIELNKTEINHVVGGGFIFRALSTLLLASGAGTYGMFCGAYYMAKSPRFSDFMSYILPKISAIFINFSGKNKKWD